MIKLSFPETLEAKLKDGELILAMPETKSFLGNAVNDIQLTKNFNLKEFESKDTGEVRIHPELVRKLQLIRDQVGRKVTVISGYRTKAHNAKLPNSSSTSQHLLGTAADISVTGTDGATLAKIAEQVGFKSIGITKTAIHVDLRPELRRWNY